MGPCESCKPTLNSTIHNCRGSSWEEDNAKIALFVLYHTHLALYILQMNVTEWNLLLKARLTKAKGKPTFVFSPLILYQGPKIWNSPPISITGITSFPMFKKKMIMIKFLMKRP